jgi:hypothetical protein
MAASFLARADMATGFWLAVRLLRRGTALANETMLVTPPIEPEAESSS